MSREYESSSPSERDRHDAWWEIELRTVIAGGRDYLIRRLGSVPAYVESLLSEAPERPSADTAFRRALRNIVAEWQPSVSDRIKHTSRMLDLVQSYTPVGGDIRLLAFLSRWGRFGEESLVKYSEESLQDLHMKTLATLEKYHPIPLPNGPFLHYVEVLKRDLDDPRYCGFTAGRLLELGLLEASSEAVADLIDRSPRALKGLISVILRPSNRLKREAMISAVYEHCLALAGDVPRTFIEIVESYGGSLDPHEPAIQLRDERILMRLSKEGYRRSVVATLDWDLLFRGVRDVLGAGTSSRVTDVLSETYEKCVQLGLDVPRRFERELSALGGRLEHQSAGPVVIFGDERIELSLSRDVMESYALDVALAPAVGEPEEIYQKLRATVGSTPG